ncbi:PREDICTED: chloride channel protein 2-like [Priapulus caudatus]|uniref:Chloride channel protein 2-like n=1 Tax=Priapulus caudatus TaxID=37621 RepID=A0ABM1E0Q0_PRICU|nr:PREDICTED: chloride channel protein 2-like [Priapulus caudatus]
MASRNSEKRFGYEQTVMYGHYSKDLGEYAKKEAERIRVEKDEKVEDPVGFHQYETQWIVRLKSNWQWLVQKLFGKIGEDWVFLAVLGILMACISYIMDTCIHYCQEARIWLYRELEGHVALQFFTWITFPTVFILFSNGFTHLVSAQAIGSGIPEMKTILRGVVLKEFLTFRTFVSKVVGLTSTLGSGLPVGKEGPFVHIASITATLLSKAITGFKGIYENESRKSEMLAAACAVGVACSFAAPIGGVLFSIEVTSTFFAVKNYWRGFFAAVCGAMVFRLLSVVFDEEETITALYKTNLPIDFPFDPLELIAFCFIGLMCGFIGALFVYVHRTIVNFNRRQKALTRFLQKNRFIYPAAITIFISSVTFPLGLGRYIAGGITMQQAVNELFSNITWCCGEVDVKDEALLNHWRVHNVFVSLSLYIFVMFFLSALAQTIPVASGVFIPVFVLGAAFGRLVGETMAVIFPAGIRMGATDYLIVPGGYAVVGAAALSGSVTHTISTSVIVFELTGQIAHILPVMLAVLISNAVANMLQPSIYDSIIRIKKLPYLPDIISSKKRGSEVGACLLSQRLWEEEQLNMVIDFSECRIDPAPFQLVERTTLYKVHSIFSLLGLQVAYVTAIGRLVGVVSLKEVGDSMILLGSVRRVELEYAFNKHVGRERKLQPVEKKMLAGITEIPSSSHISRFTVSPAILDTRATSTDNRKRRFKPIKSILKRAKSPNTTIELNELTAVTSSMRSDNDDSPYDTLRTDPGQGTLTSYPGSPQSTITSNFSGRHVQLPEEVIRIVDLPIEQQRFVEEETGLEQLVHSIFSLLGLQVAYVTAIGRLVGVVSLKELRFAIEGTSDPSTMQRSASSSPQKEIEIPYDGHDDDDDDDNDYNDDNDDPERGGGDLGDGGATGGGGSDAEREPRLSPDYEERAVRPRSATAPAPPSGDIEEEADDASETVIGPSGRRFRVKSLTADDPRSPESFS